LKSSFPKQKVIILISAIITFCSGKELFNQFYFPSKATIPC